ncbi:acyl-[acyl-carrier-protein]--UDP-N-acetylglucosamine O-acyltransferase [Bacilli bacterium]|nr:acyl-[acyl-carrier-protein]--UDP-N-acetylglucosamine O-acyltransferase [Bacilli bacterium]
MKTYDYIRNRGGIHPAAIVDMNAQIGNNVKIGPYCIVGPEVVIGDNCELKPHVVLEGRVEIGDNNKIFSFAVMGQDPQDLKYDGERSSIVIGNGNRIREHCTIHPGTRGGNMVTKIGDNNLFMVNTHIAHDCVIGSNCVFANNVTLGGHVSVGDYTVIGGLTALHQKVQVGEHAMIGGMTAVERDIIPYGVAVESRTSSLEGINVVGLKRRNFSKQDINDLRSFYRDVFCSESGNLFELVEDSKEKYANSKVVQSVIEFLEGGSDRHFMVKFKTNG